MFLYYYIYRTDNTPIPTESSHKAAEGVTASARSRNALKAGKSDTKVAPTTNVSLPRPTAAGGEDEKEEVEEGSIHYNPHFFVDDIIANTMISFGVKWIKTFTEYRCMPVVC